MFGDAKGEQILKNTINKHKRTSEMEGVGFTFSAKCAIILPLCESVLAPDRLNYYYSNTDPWAKLFHSSTGQRVSMRNIRMFREQLNNFDKLNEPLGEYATTAATRMCAVRVLTAVSARSECVFHIYCFSNRTSFQLTLSRTIIHHSTETRAITQLRTVTMMLLMNVLKRLILTIVSDEVEKSFYIENFCTIEFRLFLFASSVRSFLIVCAHLRPPFSEIMFWAICFIVRGILHAESRCT